MKSEPTIYLIVFYISLFFRFIFIISSREINDSGASSQAALGKVFIFQLFFEESNSDTIFAKVTFDLSVIEMTLVPDVRSVHFKPNLPASLLKIQLILYHVILILDSPRPGPTNGQFLNWALRQFWFFHFGEWPWGLLKTRVRLKRGLSQLQIRATTKSNLFCPKLSFDWPIGHWNFDDSLNGHGLSSFWKSRKLGHK